MSPAETYPGPLHAACGRRHRPFTPCPPAEAPDLAADSGQLSTPTGGDVAPNR